MIRLPLGRRSPLAALLLLLPVPALLPAQIPTSRVDSALIAGLRWRNIGPANMGGRISDIAGLPSPSKTFFVAAAAGGIWKTTNAGTTFRLVFGGSGNEGVVSMGMLAIAPSDSNQVWAGSGEPNSRNSLSPGKGIFKSTDGGITWKPMGLEKTQAIGRIVVHPTDPNTVYVAALGAIWNANPERGLYQTTDGGQSWKLIKFISDKAGFVDVAMDPSNPNTLYAASWERVRGPYFLQSGGAGSALWKSTDAGATWTEIKGNGFPETMKGRIGIGIAASNPQIVYTMVEADTAPNPSPVKGAKRQESPSGLYRSNDGGKTWAKVAPQNVRPFYYSQVRVDPTDPGRVYFTSTPRLFSSDSGKTVRAGDQGVHVDTHAHWIDPADPNHMVEGNDGGVWQTWDRGGNWMALNTIPIGQFYNVSFDYGIPYRVCGGLQDNGSWCGPSRRRGAIGNANWFNISGGDGFHTAQNADDPRIVYGESQGGNIQRVDLSTGERTGLTKPGWRPHYLRWQDSIIAVRGDTTRPETKEMKARLAELRARATKDSLDLQLRWNWNTPYFLSPHNQKVFYAGANRVMKSVKMGDEMSAISPDLSNNDTIKVRVSTRTTGGITTDATGAETYATIVSLAESPIRPGLLYAGTDDGNVWLTRNDGGSWENLTGRFPGVPKFTYVSRIEPSYADSATFYVTFDNHRTGDFTPYVYATNDYGKSFRSIVSNLPSGGLDFVHVIREDPANPSLLFAGTETGAFVSTDKGASWRKFMSGFPTVPVHDLKIHPRDHELIAATHGRSIWIVDVAPLEQVNEQVIASAVHLFQPKTAWQFNSSPEAELGGGGSGGGQMVFRSMPPQYGAEIAYRVATTTPGGRARISIVDASGDTLRTLTGSAAAGLNRVYWPFQGKAPARRPLSPAQRRDSIMTVQRIDKAIDSLVANAGASRTTLDSLKGQLLSGGGIGGFGGGGGGGGGGFGAFAGAPGIPAFAARPAEGAVQRVGAGGGAGGGGG
ncbi:MAG TPA: hypothetical protein VGQ17_15530, partial [Gemmatimonadales bacterium]|nr:hypothetical protein [Gemmatimonadales bacterium]